MCMVYTRGVGTVLDLWSFLYICVNQTSLYAYSLFTCADIWSRTITTCLLFSDDSKNTFGYNSWKHSLSLYGQEWVCCGPNYWVQNVNSTKYRKWIRKEHKSTVSSSMQIIAFMKYLNVFNSAEYEINENFAPTKEWQMQQRSAAATNRNSFHAFVRR